MHHALKLCTHIRSTERVQMQCLYTTGIKITRKTTLDRGQTDRISLTHDLYLQSPASYGHDLLTCKVQGQLSVGSEDRLETNGRMEVNALLMRSVNTFYLQHNKSMHCEVS